MYFFDSSIDISGSKLGSIEILNPQISFYQDYVHVE